MAHKMFERLFIKVVNKASRCDGQSSLKHPVCGLLLMSSSFGVSPGSFFSATPLPHFCFSYPEQPRSPVPLEHLEAQARSLACNPAPHICCLPRVPRCRSFGHFIEPSSSSKPRLPHLNITSGTEVNHPQPLPTFSWAFCWFPAIVHSAFPFPYRSSSAT